MEITFVSDKDYECPYCHNILDDVGEERVCRGCGKKLKIYTLEAEEYENY